MPRVLPMRRRAKCIFIRCLETMLIYMEHNFYSFYKNISSAKNRYLIHLYRLNAGCVCVNLRIDLMMGQSIKPKHVAESMQIELN